MSNLPEFSASRFNTYKTCARMYYYQYSEQQPKSVHAYTVMGSALHFAIEHFYKTKEQPLTVFSTKFNELSRAAASSVTGIVAGNLISKAHQIGQDILREFDWGKLNPTEIELGFRFEFPTENPLVIMRGFMDMITEEGYIIDHKSAGKRPTKAELAVNPQLLLYVWAYERMYGKKPVKVYWHHLRTAELIEADVLTDYDTKLQALVDTLRTILADTEYQKQPYGYFCTNLCSYHDLCWSQQTHEKSVIGSGGIEGLF